MRHALAERAPLHTAEEKTYIVTHDFPSQVQLFKGIGLKVPTQDHPIYQQISDGLIHVLNLAFPKVCVRSINMTDLSQKIWELAAQRISDRKTETISTCFEIATTRRGHTLEVNRIVDFDGNIIGLGPRPGYPSIADQLDSISRLVDSTPVVLMEDGSFSGGTLVALLQKMKARNIKVSALVIGVCFPQAIERLQEVFDGEIAMVEKMDQPLDWIPDHDLFPFIPNCGRVIGYPFDGECLPFYSFEGASYSFPYIDPFGSPEKWASIPEDRTWTLSNYCICRMTEFFKLMNELNCRSLTIADIAFTTPRVSVPFRMMDKKLLRMDTDIVAYLEHLRASRAY